MGKRFHRYGLRMVAVVEALKGVAVVALSLVLLSLLHKDLDAVVDRLIEVLRVNPDSRVADWFYEVADRTTGRGIWTAVSVGLLYATGRFVEGYGLWRERHWAEWFAVISGAVYLPVEIYALCAHPHWTRFAVLVGNFVVVFYILKVLVDNRRERCCPPVCEGRPASGAVEGPPNLECGGDPRPVPRS